MNYLANEFHWYKVLKHLCRLWAIWTWKGNRDLHVSSNELSRYGLAWFYFICARLLPYIHLSEINRDRAALLYAIIIRKMIDVGQVIQNLIRQAIKGNVSDGLPHPSLISGLCKATGVMETTTDKRQSPQEPITSDMMCQFRIGLEVYLILEEYDSLSRQRHEIIQQLC